MTSSNYVNVTLSVCRDDITHEIERHARLIDEHVVDLIASLRYHTHANEFITSTNPPTLARQKL